MDDAPEPVLELWPEEVQPICWSDPKAFFRLGDDARHARELNAEAWCYMLAQQNILRDQANEPDAKLLNERSFFSFLLRRSLCAAGPPGAAEEGSSEAEEFGVSSGRAAPRALKSAFEGLSVAEHRAHNCESISGPGSSLLQTQEIRRRLPLLLQSLNVKTVLDAPCGDFNWMARVHLGTERYIGVDLLEDVIQRNIKTYEAPGRTFSALNILEDPLPKSDLVLCRDCLGHLSNGDILRALRNFARSRSEYMLATTFPERAQTADIVAGAWRPLNLQAAPFLLPQPLQLLTEKCSEGGGAFRDKSLGLWRLADVQEACRSRVVDEGPGEPSIRAQGRALTQPKGRACRILIGICSSQSTSERRKAVREAWMTALPDGVDATFFVGDGAAIDGPDVVAVAAPDDYAGLILKVTAFLRHAVEKHEFDYLFKCDDDTYVAAERIFDLIGDGAAFVGCKLLAPGGVAFASGGAGYLLSHDAARFLAEAAGPGSGPEDVWVSARLIEAGFALTHSPHLRIDHKDPPTANNRLLSAHYCDHQTMVAIHRGMQDGRGEHRLPATLHARHAFWRGALTLFPDGRFVGGGAQPDGRWAWDGRRETLTLNWLQWPPDRLRIGDAGFHATNLRLEFAPGDCAAYWRLLLAASERSFPDV